MKIAITGGSVLIETELIKLFNQEHNITVLDFKESKISGVNFVKIDYEDLQMNYASSFILKLRMELK